MVLNDAGQMIVKWWNELPNKFPNIILGEFVVMPNHFHGNIFIMNPVGADLRVGPDLRVDADDIEPEPSQKGGHIGPPQRKIDVSLSHMIQWFKTMTTNKYIREVKESKWVPFNGRVWQRNYYEHIVRSERALEAIRQYIADNPARWALDRYNPLSVGPDPQGAELWRLLQDDAGCS